MHGTEAVSPWVARWSHLLPAHGYAHEHAQEHAHTRVLDVACGAGRHTLHFLRQKYRLVGIDIDDSAIKIIANQLSEEEKSRCELICADIENQPWPAPLQGRKFDAVIVTNYLWRPLMPTLLQSLDEAGVLIYETFAAGNETVGKPSRPDFLLKPGELLQMCAQEGLRVVAYEDGFLQQPARFMQRIAAVREKSSSIGPARHLLQP
jgi:SAM-dependent methyltransferase